MGEQLKAQELTIEALIHYQEQSKQQMPAFLQNIALHKVVARKTEELKNSQRFLETVIDTLDSGLCILDAKGTILKVNRSWEQSSGDHLGPEPWVGCDYLSHCRELSSSDNGFPPSVFPSLEAILKGESSHYQSVYSEECGGRLRWYQMRAIRLLDVRLGRVLILHSDISELIEAQKELEARGVELKDREAYFRTITEGANDPIVMVDEQGEISLFNYAAEQAFEYRAEEALGRSIQDLVPSLHPGQLENGRESSSVIGIKKCGVAFPLRLSLSSLKLSTGNTHFSCIFHDLTEIQKMEQDLAQARKLESIGQLAAGISHEINTPLQYLADNFSFVEETCGKLLDVLTQFRDSPKAGPEFKAALEQLEFDYLKEELPDAITQSMQGLERITNIVAAMRDFSHTSSQKTLADLNSGIESTITVTRNEWKYVADLETEFDPDLGLVPCFLSDIKQVVLNLIVNASHAIAEKKRQRPGFQGRIVVKTQRQEGMVKVTVTDNGTGVPKGLRHCIFDPFFTTKEVGVGTGQGLSIARRIITEKHEGELQFHCPPEGGTIFYFSIPLDNEARAA